MKSIKALGIVLYLFLITCLAVKGTINWSNDLKNYLEENNRENQILILFNRSDQINEKTIDFSRSFKTITFNFENALSEEEEKNLEKSIFFNYPQGTLIVISLTLKNSSNLADLEKPLNFISRVSEPRTRSRVLIIIKSQNQEGSFYKNLLLHLWTRQFLDVTILELMKEEFLGENFFLKTQEEIAMIHQYNPFSKIYSRIPFETKIDWFPKKTENLHGYEMKVGLFPYPPTVYVADNNKSVEAFGSDIELTKTFSKDLNFRIKWIYQRNESTWGDIQCPKEKSQGHMYRVMNNEVRYIAAQSGRYYSCSDNLVEWSRGTKVLRVSLMVPIALDDPNQVLTSGKHLDVLFFIVFFLMIRILSRVLLFDKEIWNLETFFQMMLGMSVAEPRKLTERILFGALLLFCLIGSSFIFSALTEINLKEKPLKKLETISDVVKSNLEIMMPDSLYLNIYNYTEGDERILLDKATRIATHKICSKNIQEGRKIVCILRSDMAQLSVENHRDQKGKAILKILKEPFMLTVTGLVLEARSPFIERFDEIVMRMTESGIVRKWEQIRYNNTVNVHSENSNNSESTVFPLQIIILLLLGYLSALIVFFYEVFLLKKKGTFFNKFKLRKL